MDEDFEGINEDAVVGESPPVPATNFNPTKVHEEVGRSRGGNVMNRTRNAGRSKSQRGRHPKKQKKNYQRKFDASTPHKGGKSQSRDRRYYTRDASTVSSVHDRSRSRSHGRDMTGLADLTTNSIQSPEDTKDGKQQASPPPPLTGAEEDALKQMRIQGCLTNPPFLKLKVPGRKELYEVAQEQISLNNEQTEEVKEWRRKNLGSHQPKLPGKLQRTTIGKRCEGIPFYTHVLNEMQKVCFLRSKNAAINPLMLANVENIFESQFDQINRFPSLKSQVETGQFNFPLDQLSQIEDVGEGASINWGPIKLKGFYLDPVTCDLMHNMFIPMYEICGGSAYIDAESEGRNGHGRVSYLPPGYFRPLRHPYHNNHHEIKKRLTGTGCQDWELYHLELGFFFYQDKVYLINDGYLVSPPLQGVRNMRVMHEISDFGPAYKENEDTKQRVLIDIRQSIKKLSGQHNDNRTPTGYEKKLLKLVYSTPSLVALAAQHCKKIRYNRIFEQLQAGQLHQYLRYFVQDCLVPIMKLSEIRDQFVEKNQSMGDTFAPMDRNSPLHVDLSKSRQMDVFYDSLEFFFYGIQQMSMGYTRYVGLPRSHFIHLDYAMGFETNTVTGERAMDLTLSDPKSKEGYDTRVYNDTGVLNDSNVHWETEITADS